MNGKMVVIACVVAVLSALLLLFGWHCYPLFRVDASFFVPAAINLVAGRGLTNPLHPVIRRIDKSGLFRYLSYVPLFPVVLSKLMWAPTPQSAYVAIAVLNSLSLALSAFLFYKLATLHQKKLNGFGVLLIGLSLVGMATHFAGRSSGRPEILGTLLFVITALTVLCWHKKPFLKWVLGLLLGAMGCTHPIGGVMLGLMITIYYAVTLPPKKALTSLALTTLTAALSFLVLLRLSSPYDFREIFPAIVQHAHVAVDMGARAFTLSEFLQYYFLLPHLTFYGLIVAFSLVAFAHLYRLFKGNVQSLALFWLGVAALAVTIYKTSVDPSFSSYNLFLFTPLFYGLMIYYTLHILGKPLLLKAIPVVIMLLTTTGFLRSALFFPYFLESGRSLAEARALFKPIQETVSASIGVTPSMWVLSEDYERIFLLRNFENDELAKAPQKKNAVVVLQQNYVSEFPALKPMDRVKEHILYKNFFIPQSPSLFGIRLTKTIPGYQFAVYVPTTHTWNKADQHPSSRPSVFYHGDRVRN